MSKSSLSLFVATGVTLVFSVMACDATSDSVFGSNDGGAGGSGGAGAEGGTTAATGGDPNITVGAGTGGTGNATTCDSLPDEDNDMDGYTGNDGDCNDCDANVNPAAIEVVVTEEDPETMEVPEPADENCDGNIDTDVPVACDGAFALDETDPFVAAAAVELCDVVDDVDQLWGLVDAQWVRANGTPLTTPSEHYGIQTGFGPNVPAIGGTQMVALSSGHARIPGQPGACGTQSCGDLGAGVAPAGFPQNVPSCPTGTNINDDVGLEVTLRAPSNATGYSFNFDFYTFEYPEWICDLYNDQFIALVTPPPMGSINGNISFDSMTNPVSVNIALFDVCPPPCALGTAELVGTGFDTWNDAGATGMLQTTAPIAGGEEFTIRWAIFDTQDAFFDSTVLVDNFQWIASGGTVAVGTTPVPK